MGTSSALRLRCCSRRVVLTPCRRSVWSLLSLPRLDYIPLPFGAIGYEGEGPFARKVVRNAAGVEGAPMGSGSSTPVSRRPPRPTSRTGSIPSRASASPASTRSNTPEPGDIEEGGADGEYRHHDWKVEDLASLSAREDVLLELNKAKRDLSRWRSKARSSSNSTPVVVPKLATVISERVRVPCYCMHMFCCPHVPCLSQGQYNRDRAMEQQITELLDRVGDEEKATILSMVFIKLSDGARVAWRLTGAGAVERYLAVRDSIRKLRSEWWTASNWFELKVVKHLSTSVLEFGDKLFCKTQNNNGEWTRGELLPAPPFVSENRRWKIWGAMGVPSIVRNPGQVAAAQDKQLEHQTLVVSADGKAANFHPIDLARESVVHARKADNFREAADCAPKVNRVQLLCDALGFFKGGRMATRIGVRSMDLQRHHNSPYYFHGIGLYLGGDKHEMIARYLQDVFDLINVGICVAYVNLEYITSVFVTLVAAGPTGEDLRCEVCEGGDAAAGNEMAGLECPPSHLGCCYYCELRKTKWFDEQLCTAAQRRTYVRSMLSAHLIPACAGFEAPDRWCCPHCDKVLTAATVASECKDIEAMSTSARDKWLINFRRQHTGQRWRKHKFLHTDHINRQISLLHFMLNAVSNTLGVCVAAGATPQVRSDLNAVLERYHCTWRIKDKKSKDGKEKKPAGNECRHLLWDKGLFLELLRTRWGVEAPTQAQAEMEAGVEVAQEAGAVNHPENMPRHRTPAPAKPRVIVPDVGAKKRKQSAPKRSAVTMAPRPSKPLPPPQPSPHPPPPPPPKPPPPPPLPPPPPPPVSREDNEPDDDHAETMENEMEVGEVTGNYNSALRTVQALLHVMNHLTADDWDDTDMAERKTNGAQAGKLGKKWAESLNAHSGNTSAFYYAHLAFAHLEELIIKHGRLAAGNDEILERTNCDAKEDKRHSFYGGDSVARAADEKNAAARKEGTADVDTRASSYCFKKARGADGKAIAGAEPVMYSVRRKRQRGVAEYCKRLERSRELMQQSRVHAADSLTAKRALTRKMKAARRVGVKAEAIQDAAAAIAEPVNTVDV